MNVLIACEESQAVCLAFRKKGHKAYSCDIQKCSGGHLEWHIIYDVLKVLEGGFFNTENGDLHEIWNWDLVISFQPCTDLAISGAAHFEKKRLSGQQEKSIRFFFDVWKRSNCSENPLGILNGGGYIKKWFPKLFDEMKSQGFTFKATQIIHPYYFGDNIPKKTCLWLRNLKPLVYSLTDNLFESKTSVEPEYIEYNSAKTKSGKSKYSVFGRLGSGKGKERSKTFPGIANAMADQWGV